MKVATLALIGGGCFLAYRYILPGIVVANLKFIEDGMDFDVSNPLRVNCRVRIIVQNPTSGTVTLKSLAGYFFVNGKQSGNVSFFYPTAILANSQTEITLNLSVNDIALVGLIMDYINSGSTDIVVSVKATANANDVPVPVDISFQPI